MPQAKAKGKPSPCAGAKPYGGQVWHDCGLIFTSADLLKPGRESHA
jgi:hypothetical protein